MTSQLLFYDKSVLTIMRSAIDVFTFSQNFSLNSDQRYLTSFNYTFHVIYFKILNFVINP